MEIAVMKTSFNAALVAAVLVASTMVASAAFAGSEDTVSRLATEHVTETVRFGDLDLSSLNGVRTLDERIHKAASRVCLQLVEGSGPNGLESARCRVNLVDAAVAHINRPRTHGLRERQDGACSAQRQPLSVG